MKIDKKILDKYVAEKKLVVQKHPQADLFIYNYSRTVQFDRLWDDITLSCRGLITDGEGNVVSRPLKKFFNFSEPQPEEIPTDLPYKLYNKMDGSMMVSYKLDGKDFLASKGSFSSDQAIEGNKILTDKYTNVKFKDGLTYVMELLTPFNRIVVDYGDMRDLVLLAIVDNATGKDMPLEDIGIPIVEEVYHRGSFEELQSLNFENEEGYILVYENGFRLKIKFDDYVALHKVMTNVSSIDLWKMKMFELDPVKYSEWDIKLEDIIGIVPDEFYSWIKKTLEDMYTEAKALEKEARSIYKDVMISLESGIGIHREPNQSDFAKEIKGEKKKVKSLLFALRKGDEKRMIKIIWAGLKPKHNTPFKERV